MFLLLFYDRTTTQLFFIVIFNYFRIILFSCHEFSLLISYKYMYIYFFEFDFVGGGGGGLVHCKASIIHFQAVKVRDDPSIP